MNGDEGNANESVPAVLSEDERLYLLALAREGLKAVAFDLPQPEPEPSTISSGPLLLERSCFVTLYKDNALRGCVGNLRATEPLWRAVLESARAAASRDPRFPRVQPEEVNRIRIEISILGEAHPIHGAAAEELLAQIVPGKHGVILRLSGSMATFLPQVWEQIPIKVDFLNALSRKAGLGVSAWLQRDAELSVYEVTRLEEA